MSRLKLWLPTLLWAGVISSLSTESFSSDHTGPIVLGVLHWLIPWASPGTLDLLHVLIRKSAHFTEYFVFSLLLLRSIRGVRGGWQLRWAITAIAIAAVYAALDETHQYFVPGREASPWDASLDTVGAAAAQIAAWLYTRRIQAQSDSREERTGGTPALR